MSILYKKYIHEDGIKFSLEIGLSNGIIGKNIEIDGIYTNYIITKDAKVYNITTERELKQFIGKKCSYRVVNIQLGTRGKYKTVLIHRLLGLAFIPNIDNKPIINHKDGNKVNLDLNNLEWVTYSENNFHAFKNGLKKPSSVSSEKCNLTRHTKNEAILVCELLSKGYSPKYISIKYENLSINFVRDIYKRKIWKELSSKYNFDKVVKYSRFFTVDEIIEMEKLFKYGLSVKRVIDEMNWEYNETLRGRVRQIKKRIKLETS